MSVVVFAIGLVLLLLGAELLVRGASRLASLVGLSPLIIGLTVVAFGTSAPELAVSVEAATSGKEDIALGNVVGSNIFNILFILGLSALITPITVSQQLVRLDVPLMVLVSGGVFALGLDGMFGHLDGLLLLAGLCVYFLFLWCETRRKNQSDSQGRTDRRALGPRSAGRWIASIALVAAGLLMIAGGSKWFVEATVALARYLGASDQVIALTLVAAGTSLPEVVTSIVAALRREIDIAVGNVVGSNLFNLMGVLGLSSILAPTGVGVSSAMLAFDIPIMLMVALACLPVFFTGSKISRWEGALFLAYYVAYTLYLVLAASQHDALQAYTTAILYFAIPLTAVTLTILSVREAKRGF